MKIGIDCRMLISRPTGIGQYIFNLIRYLTQIDRLNQYVLYANNEILKNIVKNYGNFELKIVNINPLSIKEQLFFSRIIKKNKLDVFHIPSFTMPFNVNGNIVITLHDLIHLKLKKEFNKIIPLYYNLIVKRVLKKAFAIITDSNNSKNDIMKWTGLPENKIKKIYPGVSKSFYLVRENRMIDSIKDKFRIEGNFIFYNGSKKPHKNVLAIIGALSLLKRKYSLSYKLVVAGMQNSKYRETNFSKIKYKVKNLNLGDDTIYTGYVDEDDLCLLYNASSLFVFPSFYEGFGFPPLEAMACGCPVVVSNTSSLPEVCGDAAYYVNPYSVDSIAEGIHKVLTDENLRKSLIQKGLERVKMFSWEKCARETLKVYEGIFK